MNTSKILGVILIIASLFIGFIGISKISDNSQQINLLGLKIDASNESGQKKGLIYVGLAVILFAGGIYTSKSKI
ncbi:MAG: hypothetical protein WAT79_02200 [Saprospiraceae bacterium]